QAPRTADRRWVALRAAPGSAHKHVPAVRLRGPARGSPGGAAVQAAAGTSAPAVGAEPHPTAGAHAQLRLPRRAARAIHAGARGALPARAPTHSEAVARRTVVDTCTETGRPAPASPACRPGRPVRP